MFCGELARALSPQDLFKNHVFVRRRPQTALGRSEDRQQQNIFAEKEAGLEARGTEVRMAWRGVRGLEGATEGSGAKHGAQRTPEGPGPRRCASAGGGHALKSLYFSLVTRMKGMGMATLAGFYPSSAG